MIAIVVGVLSVPWRAAPGPATAAIHPGHHAIAQAAPRPAAVPPAGPEVSFDFPRAQLPQQPEVASLAIPGRNGTYLVPYIQTQPDLHFRLNVQRAPADSMVLVTLDAGSDGQRETEVVAPGYEGVFGDVVKGDHTLSARLYQRPQRIHVKGTEGQGDQVASTRLTHVARGDIIAAIGDSTTEGNGGPSFGFMPNWVSAQAMAADWTSPDGRNFPQAGAFARPQAPASFTSTLGTLLEGVRGHPVLVLNDGWSGATAEAYSHIVVSPDLGAEYGAAHPNDWLINLGVNDPITHRTPEQFDANMHAITSELAGRFGAQPAAIHVACPSWAGQDFRHQAEALYLPVIQRLRATVATGAAPNFYAWYRDTPGNLADEVHPNAAGYRAMASLWGQALGGYNSSCV
ncbi:MAG TPA: SGNH/GDSL hydrolase family protein [Candidatus Dormibacteraeota bacterium]